MPDSGLLLGARVDPPPCGASRAQMIFHVLLIAPYEILRLISILTAA